MQIAKYDEIPWSVSPGTRGGGDATSKTMAAKGQEGFKYKRLFTGAVGQPGNFEMVVLRTEDAQDVKHYPRHNHAFEQVRLTLQGEPDWTPGSVTPEGWVIYMGAGTAYGPYNRQAGHEQLHVQFQGVSCPPFLNYEEMTAARDALAKKGKFEKGVFTWIDEQGRRHNKDGHAATVEQATGVELVVPKPRYADPVNMDPQAYEWTEVAPGVQRRDLGSFTEGETRIGFLRLEKGAAYEIPRAAQRQLFFVHSGTGTAGGKTIGARDGLMVEPDEAGAKIVASSALEFFILGLPKLAPAQTAQGNARKSAA